MPEVKQEGVGTIGFCFGGHVVYLTAVLERVVATASFYGAQIATWCPGEDKATIEHTKDITATIYTFFGTEDPLIPTNKPNRSKPN